MQAIVNSGTNLPLTFISNAWSDRPEDRLPTREFVDFEREVGKVSIYCCFFQNLFLKTQIHVARIVYPRLEILFPTPPQPLPTLINVSE